MSGKFIRELLNSNTLSEYNAILQMFCVGYTDTLTMSVPLQVLKLMGADFDKQNCHIYRMVKLCVKKLLNCWEFLTTKKLQYNPKDKYECRRKTEKILGLVYMVK